MNSGDFVLIEYVGKVKDSGEIFDLTRESVAKEKGIHNKDFRYGPVPLVVDASFVIPGLNDALKEMKVGDKKTVEIKPEKAFGGRREELIKIIPEARFKEQDIDSSPGSFVTINRLRGKVISNDGGRVKVDFNHPLAGKTLEYDMEIVKQITETNEKLKSLVYYFTGIDQADIDVEVKEKIAEIIFKKHFNILADVKEAVAKNSIKWIEGIEKLKFVDLYEEKLEKS